MATLPEAGLDLVVHRRCMLTDTVCEFDLRLHDGGTLPPFEAGASLIVHTPSGERRNYSLCNDDTERYRYVVAVKKDSGSRGGSRSMHESGQVGAPLKAELSRNGLHLSPGHRHLLVAGGIGITPILSLLRRLARDPANEFELIYLARTRDEAAYADEITGMELGNRATLYFTAEHGGARFDLRPLLADNGTGRHLYYCGPGALMRGVAQMSIHWPRSHVHFEHFTTLARSKAGDETFFVKQASSGQVFRVGADQSILDALRASGLQPAASCESGTCGKCRMTLVSGEVEHRDMYLTPGDHRVAMMPCVSRATEDAVLELDF